MLCVCGDVFGEMRTRVLCVRDEMCPEGASSSLSFEGACSCVCVLKLRVRVCMWVLKVR